MKYSITMAALLTLLVSSDPTAQPLRRIFQLQEIQTVLQRAINCCNDSQNACKEILMPEVIPRQHLKALPPAEAFCKAAVALRNVKTEERGLNCTLKPLANVLIINGLERHHGKPVNCLMAEQAKVDAEIDLQKFLKSLLKFSQMQYQKTGLQIMSITALGSTP